MKTAARNLLLTGLLTGIAIAGTAGTASAGDPAKGRKVYQTTCVACHGKNGKGVVPGAPDFTSARSPLAIRSDELLFKHVKEGFQSPGSMMAMPPKGGNPSLTDDDIRDVIAYLHEAFGKRAKK